MNKTEVLIATGRLEVRLQDNEKLLGELLQFCKLILENNIPDAAICVGRLLELIHDSDDGQTKADIGRLNEFVISQDDSVRFSSEQSNVLDLKLDELDLSVRAYNCLTRAGKTTVRDLVNMSEADFKNIRNLGRNAADEILKKLTELGFEPKEGFKFKD